MTTKPHPWGWFTENVLPPVFAELTLGAITYGVATYQSVLTRTSKLEQTDKKMAQLEARIEVVDANSVKRAELLETMKRVELQLELMMAKANIKNANITQ